MLRTDPVRSTCAFTPTNALLMHAGVLADAEAAAEPAKHAAIVAAAQATEPQMQARTAADLKAVQEAFMHHVTRAEEGINHALQEQRCLAREALHRIFPAAITHTGLHQVRTHLIEGSGLGLDAYHQAYREIGRQERRLVELQAAYRSAVVDFGRPAVTHDDVEQARTAAADARTTFEDLRISRPHTLRALKALSNAARQDYPAPDTPATRAARLAAQSRERARTAAASTPAAAPRTDPAAQQQARHAGLQSGLREGPGLRHA
ncbi:hypothetical protein SAMN05216532_0300 [Streptomyces sp. 2231.1]|nr:hypothetical protein SAMN05216532_0300 [Streptomyces sp. 2231.1]